MKKSTLEALYNLVNGNGSVTDELRADVVAEYERLTAKSRANADLYNTAHDVVMASTAWDKPMTVKELWAVVSADMPEGFTASKMQYAFLHYWTNEVQRHENGKDAYKYSRV